MKQLGKLKPSVTVRVYLIAINFPRNWEDHKFLKVPFNSHFRLIRLLGDQTDINSEGMKFLWEFCNHYK